MRSVWGLLIWNKLKQAQLLFGDIKFITLQRFIQQQTAARTPYWPRAVKTGYGVLLCCISALEMVLAAVLTLLTALWAKLWQREMDDYRYKLRTRY